MEIVTIDFGVGCHIRNAAEQLVAAAAERGSAKGEFNGIRLVADRTSTADDIVADYDTLQDAAARAYRMSPEGQKAQREKKQRAKAAQELYAAQMAVLPSLDFSNQVAVLDWLCAIQPATDHEAVTTNRDAILAAFAAHDLLPDVNCGDDFREGDRDNEYLWLVGQALSTLQHVAIYGLVHKFAAEWKVKFAREVA